MRDTAQLSAKAETELMQIELQKSGTNQKKYRCDKFFADVRLINSS